MPKILLSEKLMIYNADVGAFVVAIASSVGLGSHSVSMGAQSCEEAPSSSWPEPEPVSQRSEQLVQKFSHLPVGKKKRVKSLGDAVDRGVCGGASPFTLGTSLKIYDAAYAYRSWLGQWMWWRAQQKHARRWKIVAFSF